MTAALARRERCSAALQVRPGVVLRRTGDSDKVFVRFHDGSERTLIESFLKDAD